MSVKSKTSETVEKLEKFREEVMEQITSREESEVNFQVGDLIVENGKLKFLEHELSKDSTKKILSHLRVKNNFLDLQKKMSEEDWATVEEKLKLVSASQQVYARRAKDNGIIDLHIANKKAPNGGIQIPEIFSMLRENLLNSSADDYRVTDMYFHDEKDQVSITLLNDNREVDIFTTGEDMWKTGKRITWSGVDFGIFPFFERLVCTNGNVSKQYGFESSIAKSKYNFTRIQSILEREIMHASDAAVPLLLDATRHLKKSNISVKEYLQFRNFFDEEAHDGILKKYFDISFLNSAYRCDIEGMHAIWKSTADTGKNAYDFFNDLTYIASHPKEINLEEDKRRKLQIVASDLLFKETLDLELVAPKVTLKKS
jgi:hypothetical protein